jgi:hypothetical protein
MHSSLRESCWRENSNYDNKIQASKMPTTPLTFLAEIQEVFWKEVLGSPKCPSQWKLPFKTESDGLIQIEPIQEQNTVVRGMLHCIENILQHAIPEREHDFKAKLIVACSKHSDVIKLLTTHRALTDKEMDNSILSG